MCGRTARTVRRAGTAQAVSDPYQLGRKAAENLRYPAAYCAVIHLNFINGGANENNDKA